MASDLDRQLVAPLLGYSVHTIPARRTICGPRDWSEFVYVICSGWATSSISLPDGRRQILSFHLPGEIVSIASLFDLSSGHLVEAVTDVTYRKFKSSEMKALLLKSPELLETLFRTGFEERSQADQLALDLGRRTAEERVARHILNLMDRLKKRGMARGQTMDFPQRQQQIADATGLTPVHVSKVLGKFQRANLIKISDRSLAILDMAELCRVAECR